MSGIRNDLFPRMTVFQESKKQVMGRYVDEAFEAVGNLFSSKQDFINYLNSIKDRGDAELFIRICHFYRIAKKYQSRSYVKLIMIISAIERLVNKENEYQEFYNWIESQDELILKELCVKEKIDVKNFKKIIRALKEDYFKIFGSQRNVLKFLTLHLSVEDKAKICRYMRANWTDATDGFSRRIYGKLDSDTQEKIIKIHSFGKRLMPYCYNWEMCFIEDRDCNPNYGCLLLENPDLRERILKKVVADIYQMRSDFVHDAKITPLNEKDAIGTFGTIGRNRNKRKQLVIELTAEDLENIFEKALKHYFDGFII